MDVILPSFFEMLKYDRRELESQVHAAGLVSLTDLIPYDRAVDPAALTTSARIVELVRLHRLSVRGKPL